MSRGRSNIGKKNKHRNARAAMALVFLCLFGLSLTGCARNADSNRIFCAEDAYSSYYDVLTQALPSYSVGKAENWAKTNLANGAAVEAFDAQAIPAIDVGAAQYWYPQYLATVVLAIDRDKTDVQINSWGDLYNAGVPVGFDEAVVNSEMLLAAISYSLEGDDFTLNKAMDMLAALQSEKLLARNPFAQPIMICFDYQAAALIKSGRNIEVIVPSEGTLTYEKGLLSNTEIIINGDMESLLLESGFRLPDGRCDKALYPDAAEYIRASTVKDFGYLNAVVQAMTRMLRRNVLHIRMYTSADGREHQFFALLYMSIMVLWIALVLYRVAQKRIRRAVLYIGIILLSWMIVRLINYQLPSGPITGTYPWYCYYLFQLLLPIVFLWLAWSIDQPEAGISMPKWLRGVFLVNGILIALVLTNNFHNLVFRIDLTNPNWQSEYTYGFAFYLVQMGCYIPFVVGIVMLLWKARQSLRKRGALLLLGLFGLLVTFAIGYALRIPIAWESDYTMVVGLFSLLFSETAIQSGIFPVNSKYVTLFTNSHLNMYITDATGSAILSSGFAEKQDKQIDEHSFAPEQLHLHDDENTLVYSEKISGGHVHWQNDITWLNQLHSELQESTRKLVAANELLAEEAKIKRAIEEESSRTELMGQLENEIAVHTLKLSKMIEALSAESDQSKATARIALLTFYIKQCCNRFFRERDEKFLPADELTVYLDGLAEVAGYSGVQVIVTSVLRGHLVFRRAALLYDLFYHLISWAAWLESPHILAHLGAENGEVVFRLLTSEDAHSFQPEKSFLTAIAAVGGTYLIKDLDDAVGISLSFPQGGDSQ